jgi:hypothetical protein
MLGGMGNEIHPAKRFDPVRQSLRKRLTSVCLFSVLIATASAVAAPNGFVEGHLKIISPREVDLADGSPPAIASENYAEYPLIILSPDSKKEITRVVADANGNYRVALPAGEYVMDVEKRAKGHVRAKPRRFTVVSNQTARVDMDIDTGVR